MNQKITFQQLVALISESASTSHRVSELFVKELFATISQALVDGETVKVKGLGTFHVVAPTEAQRVNVTPGKTVEIPGDQNVVFTPDKSLAEAVNHPFSQFEQVVIPDDITDEMLAQIDVSAPLFSEPDSEPVAEPEPAPEPVAEPEPVPESVTEPEPVSEPEVMLGTPIEATLGVPIEEETQAEVSETPSRQPRFKWWMAAVATLLIAVGAAVYFMVSSRRHTVSRPTDAIAAAVDSDSLRADVRPPQPSQPQALDTIASDATPLTTLASRYYGDSSFWIYIVLENEDKIKDYNNIHAGTPIVIPNPAKYGINANDRTSVKKARQVAFDYVTQKKSVKK